MDESTTPDTGTTEDGGQVQDAGAQEASGTTDEAQQEKTPEFYERELKKARQDAAKYRTKYQEVRPLADKYKQHEEENKTELEKAQERIAELEKTNHEMSCQAAKSKISQETGVPADLIPDGDEETMAGFAERMSKWLDEKTASKHSSLPRVGSAGVDSRDGREAQARKLLLG